VYPSAYVTDAGPHAGRPGAPAYGIPVASPGSSKALAVAVYTVLRIALFAAVWLTIELLTPISGLLAIIAALLVSGAISLLVLDRQRGRAASVAAGFFGRINERIEASARAEDVDDEPVAAPPAQAGPGEGEPGGRDSGEGENAAEHEAVDKQ
jgi:Protein of unknown function (DUF4229)